MPYVTKLFCPVCGETMDEIKHPKREIGGFEVAVVASDCRKHHLASSPKCCDDDKWTEGWVTETEPDYEQEVRLFVASWLQAKAAEVYEDCEKMERGDFDINLPDMPGNISYGKFAETLIEISKECTEPIPPKIPAVTNSATTPST